MRGVVVMRARSRIWFREHVERRYPIEWRTTAVLPLKRWERIAVRVLFPAEWHLPEPRLIDYAIDVLGVTEADVRDVRWLMDRDAIVLRLWNHRRFEISGLEQARYGRA